MVLGIRERTGRSVTPKTDRTAVNNSALLLLYTFSLAASLYFSLASHLSLAPGHLLPRIRTSSHMLVGALFEGPIDIIGDCKCAVLSSLPLQV